MPHESRLNFSTDEILANVDTREPLIVKGIKCHGGFDADGIYRSPRTAFRVPAIEAWQRQHVATSGTALFEIPADTVSPQVPNVSQVKFLLKAGVREPMVRWLSEIAIVEGFGAMIRELPVPPLNTFIREDTAGTALAHLASGLFEAHARDEAGWSGGGRAIARCGMRRAMRRCPIPLSRPKSMPLLSRGAEDSRRRCSRSWGSRSSG